jgi:long-chain acyl-CoA synthetase
MERIRYGEQVIDDAELETAIERAAGALDRLNIGSGRSVALLLRNEPQFVVLSLAIGRLGASALPINWHFKTDDCAYVIGDADVDLLLGHADLVAPLRGLPVRAFELEPPAEIRRAYRLEQTIAIAPERAWSNQLASAPLWAEPPRAAPQTMFYTSGTTGRPKGVVRPPLDTAAMQRVARVMAQVYGNRPGMRTLVCAPMHHGAPNAAALSAMRAGGLAVIMPRFEAEQALALIDQHRLTHAFMVPTMFARLLQLPAWVREKYDVSSLEHVLHGAAPCPPEIKRAMIQWWGPILHEYYASTEYGPIAVISSEEWLARPGSVGRAVPGARIAIFDEAGHALPPGATGEIFARQFDYPDFVYVNQPDARRAVEREGLATCGDVGHLDAEGYLYITDRKRDMVISGGVNLYPAEIEAVLAAMPGVADCAVFGIPDAEFGESLAACVQALPGASLSAEGVRDFVGHRLGSLKAPKLVEFRDELPREDNGKIIKRKLRDPYWANQARKI